jgi:hypothetical protein
MKTKISRPPIEEVRKHIFNVKGGGVLRKVNLLHANDRPSVALPYVRCPRKAIAKALACSWIHLLKCRYCEFQSGEVMDDVGYFVRCDWKKKGANLVL